MVLLCIGVDIFLDACSMFEYEPVVMTPLSILLPMKLIYSEGCINQQDAIRSQKYLKTIWANRYIKGHVRNDLKGACPVGLPCGRGQQYSVLTPAQ